MVERQSSDARAPAPTSETQSIVHGSVAPGTDPTSVSAKEKRPGGTSDDEDDDDDFPMIVDADPDEEDVD
jgi:hypothetical protein